MHDPNDSPWLSRRELLKAGAAGAAVFAGSALPVMADERPYGPFRMGIQSYSLRAFNLDEALQMTQKLGLHYWEAFQAHIPQTDAKEKVSELLAKLHDNNARLVSWGVQGFDGDEAKSRKVFDFAKAMRLETITADPSPEAFPILDKLVQEYRINIGIHNHGPGARYDKIASVMAAIQGHHERIGACVDTGHYLRSGEDPVAAIKQFGKRTYSVHLKDVKNKTEFTEVGRGDLRTVDLFRALRDLNYKGIVALEYEEHEKDPGKYIDLCLAATRDAVYKAINRQ